MTDDKVSIEELLDVSLKSFDNYHLRGEMIADQIVNTDLKIQAAVSESIRLCRYVVGTAVPATFIPGGTTANRLSVAGVVFTGIMKIFNMRTLATQSLERRLRNLLWTSVANVLFAVATETWTAASFSATVIFIDIPLPAFLLSAAFNVSAAAKYILEVAVDMIIICSDAMHDRSADLMTRMTFSTWRKRTSQLPRGCMIVLISSSPWEGVQEELPVR